MIETKIVETINLNQVASEYKYFGWLVESYQTVQNRFIITFIRKEIKDSEEIINIFNEYDDARVRLEKLDRMKTSGGMLSIVLFSFFVILSLIFCIIALSWLTLAFLLITVGILSFLIISKIHDDKRKKNRIIELSNIRNDAIKKIKDIKNIE